MCRICGESVIKQISKFGREFLATVYQDGYELTVVTKNGHVIEHRHI